MKAVKIIFFAFACLATASRLHGQGASIRVIASAQKDSIILRWAPDSPASWKLLNKYGYKIERYTIVRDSLMLSEKPVLVLNNTLKPASEVSWKASMNNDYVAVAAQSIFGEEFKISKSPGVMDIVQQSQELEMRYSYCLLAADVSPMAANLSALRFVDRQVKKNEKYLYRIHSLVPESAMKIEFGFVYIGADEVRVLAQPAAPQVTRLEKSVAIRWEIQELNSVYTGWFVEKSINGGKDFVRLDEVPQIPMNQKKADKSSLSLMKTDSVLSDPANTFYVVRGVTAFGEVGPASESISVTGEKPLKAVPAITKATVVENSKVKVDWSFSDAAEKEIKGFNIERRVKTDEAYTIVGRAIAPANRSFIDTKPLPTGYYRVVAFTEKGQHVASFPNLVQLEDSVGPAQPIKLVGVIDSTGIVNLQWAANTESDLEGYRVFRSNFKNSEFGQITVSPVTTTNFKDTVNIQTLGKSVWYKITAVDHRFNTSEYSQRIEIRLPDKIAPVPPVIAAIRSTDGGVEIHWIPSSSDDVVSHELLRKVSNSAAWTTVKRISVKDTSRVYFDKVPSTTLYHYSLVAIDENGLKSIQSKPVSGKAMRQIARAPLKVVSILPDRVNKKITLKWKNDNEPTKVIVYRAENDESLSLYKTIAGAPNTFSDLALKINTTYRYRIKAVYGDGSETAFSEEMKIDY